MFYKKRIEKLERFELYVRSWIRIHDKWTNEQDKKIKSDEKVTNEYLADHTNRIAEVEENIKLQQEKIDGIIEVLKSDRRDLNALINIIKKLDKPTTKGKK